MKEQRGRPVTAAFFGFLSGLFGTITLLAFGTIPLESPLVTLLPVLGLVLAFALAMWAPVGGPQTPSAPPES